MKTHTCYGNAIAGVALVASACASGISVNSDFDPQANFSSYRTFAWMPLPRNTDYRLNNDLVDGRIRSAIENQLQANGYQLGPAEGADFKVGYHAALEGKMDVRTINTYYGYGWEQWSTISSQTYVDEYTEGTLVVDIVDAKSNELVWRGSGQGEVRERADPDERTRRINDAIAKILAEFPPGG